MTPMDKKDLIVREKPGYDGATPSGNSMAAMNLLRLYDFTGNNSYVQARGKAFMLFFQNNLQGTGIPFRDAHCRESSFKEKNLKHGNGSRYGIGPYSFQ